MADMIATLAVDSRGVAKGIEDAASKARQGSKAFEQLAGKVGGAFGLGSLGAGAVVGTGIVMGIRAIRNSIAEYAKINSSVAQAQERAAAQQLRAQQIVGRVWASAYEEALSLSALLPKIAAGYESVTDAVARLGGMSQGELDAQRQARLLAEEQDKLARSSRTVATADLDSAIASASRLRDELARQVQAALAAADFERASALVTAQAGPNLARLADLDAQRRQREAFARIEALRAAGDLTDNDAIRLREDARLEALAESAQYLRQIQDLEESIADAKRKAAEQAERESRERAAVLGTRTRELRALESAVRLDVIAAEQGERAARVARIEEEAAERTRRLGDIAGLASSERARIADLIERARIGALAELDGRGLGSVRSGVLVSGGGSQTTIAQAFGPVASPVRTIERTVSGMARNIQRLVEMQGGGFGPSASVATYA